MRLVCVLFTFENNTGQTDGRTDGPTDSYRDATAHLRTQKSDDLNIHIIGVQCSCLIAFVVMLIIES